MQMFCCETRSTQGSVLRVLVHWGHTFLLDLNGILLHTDANSETNITALRVFVWCSIEDTLFLQTHITPNHFYGRSFYTISLINVCVPCCNHSVYYHILLNCFDTSKFKCITIVCKKKAPFAVFRFIFSLLMRKKQGHSEMN